MPAVSKDQGGPKSRFLTSVRMPQESSRLTSWGYGAGTVAGERGVRPPFEPIAN